MLTLVSYVCVKCSCPHPPASTWGLRHRQEITNYFHGPWSDNVYTVKVSGLGLFCIWPHQYCRMFDTWKDYPLVYISVAYKSVNRLKFFLSGCFQFRERSKVPGVARGLGWAGDESHTAHLPNSSTCQPWAMVLALRKEAKQHYKEHLRPDV